MRVTDRDRLVALRRLAVKAGRHRNGSLPFGNDQLRYTSAFLDRFSRSVTQKDSQNDASMLMVRKMVDEYLLEITAQINWFERANGANKKNFVDEFGLGLWDSNSGKINQVIKVA